MKSSRILLLSMVLGLAGCQTAPTQNSAQSASPTRSNTSTSSAARSTATLRDLIGEYDNHSQRYSDGAATNAAIPVPAMHQWLTATREADAMLWRLRSGDEPNAVEGRWLVRESAGTLVPYRPLTANANAAFDGKGDYKFQTADWAPLAACTLKRGSGQGMALAVDAGACSSLLPGLGSSAALLPQRLSLNDDTLVLATVSDMARGADATTTSHRVRWFTGWDAMNGGGPKATSGKDWHVHRDLRLHSEGGRIPLQWRDGAASGYSLELARLFYKESNTEVLRLAVIEDTSGRTMSYVWANPDATRIGLNLGWLQVGLDMETAKDRSKQ